MAATKQSVVFVSLTGDEEIKLYDIDSQTGALSLRTTSDAHGPSGALFLHPTLDVLYDAHVESTTLASFQLDKSTGQLTRINQVDTGIGIPAHLVTDRTGRFLLTAYYGGGGITVHRLGADGSIDEQLQHIDTGPKAHAVYITPDNRFVFVPHVCPTNKTCQYRFDAETGLLSPNEPFELAPPRQKYRPAPYLLWPKWRDRLYHQRAGQYGHGASLRRRNRHAGEIPTPLDLAGGPPAGQWCYRPYRSPSQRPVGLWLQSRPRQHRAFPHPTRRRARTPRPLFRAGQPALVQLRPERTLSLLRRRRGRPHEGLSHRPEHRRARRVRRIRGRPQTVLGHGNATINST